MLGRFNTSSPQRRFIGHTSLELAPNVGDRLSWVSPLLGRFLLENLASQATRQPTFKLVAGLRLDPELGGYPISHILYFGSGRIAGVLRNTYIPDESDLVSARESLEFQIENGLIAPSAEDYNNLEAYLKHAKLDAVSTQS